jgi:DNA-binding MarR family transcriptional regulator
VNRLEERGWATRQPDPSDGRAVLVSLTPAGNEALQTLQAAYHEMLAGHMAALDDEELQSLSQAVSVLDDLISRLRAASPG